MNKDFIIVDKTNNLQKKASGIVKFNYENKDYLIYDIDENIENKQIFVSRLILNSEGKYFTDNILPEEKNKLNSIVYNMIILTPSNAKKGMDSKQLINDLTEKNMIKISCDIPELNIQEYYPNCSMAITNKEFVEEASKFYESNLTEVKEEVINQTPSWTLPITEEVKIEPVAGEENITNPVEEPMEIPVSEITPEIPVINTNTESVIASAPVEPVITPNLEPVVTQTIEPAQTVVPEVKPEIPEAKVEVPEMNMNQDLTPNVVQEPSNIPVQNIEVPTQPQQFNNNIQAETNNETETITPNPQTKIMENVAIVSDPSLSAAGVTTFQQNNGQQKVKTLKKAGFAINKFVVIGTLCILLAIAVVIVAYILIQKKTTGV